MNRCASLIATVTTVVVLTCVTVWTPAATANEKIPVAQPGASRTVFIDISVFSRKQRGAHKVNEIHADHFARGWTVVDMEVYTENGDLQGYFLTHRGTDTMAAE